MDHQIPRRSNEHQTTQSAEIFAWYTAPMEEEEEEGGDAQNPYTAGGIIDIRGYDSASYNNYYGFKMDETRV